jgi:hypothetical protein
MTGMTLRSRTGGGVELWVSIGDEEPSSTGVMAGGETLHRISAPA